MTMLYKMLFFNSMISGTLISMSSFSWLTIWIGLEINLMSIIPLLKAPTNKYPSEAALKYFIAQVMASSIVLFTTIMFYISPQLTMNLSMNLSQIIMMNTALLMKLGAAPLHFWFPETLSGLNWMNSFLLLTWQKIAPLLLISYNTQLNTMMLSIIIVFSSMISGIQGLNQVCLRKILAYSSINHVSWLIASLLNSTLISIQYFLIYSIINMNIIMTLKMYNIFFLNQLSSIFSYKKSIKFIFMSNFLSLGGLPPFLGFLPKWITVNYMVENKIYALACILIIFTLISLYFYLRITFSTFTIHLQEALLIELNMMNFSYYMMNFLSLSSLTVCSLLNSIY